VRLSLDASILVCFVDVDAGQRHQQAVDLLSRASGADCFLTLQSLGEFFHVVTRKGKLSQADAVTAVENIRAALPVRAAKPDTLSTAMAAVHNHGLSFWDAMLWATVQQAGCDLLLSEDFQDGHQLGRVTFVNPFAPANQALLDRTLAPGA
jgi:predicted nucleic acid-binding protein